MSFRRLWNSLVRRRKPSSESENSEPTTPPRLDLIEPYPPETLRPWGLFRKCDLCPFVASHEFPEVIDWAIRDHMYRNHPTKGRRPA